MICAHGSLPNSTRTPWFSLCHSRMAAVAWLSCRWDHAYCHPDSHILAHRGCYVACWNRERLEDVWKRRWKDLEAVGPGPRVCPMGFGWNPFPVLGAVQCKEAKVNALPLRQLLEVQGRGPTTNQRPEGGLFAELCWSRNETIQDHCQLQLRNTAPALLDMLVDVHINCGYCV